MENKTNDEKAKRRVHARTNGTWYLVLRFIRLSLGKLPVNLCKWSNGLIPH